MRASGVAAPAHRAAGRVLDILERLAAGRSGASLSELSAALGAPKTSLLPLLRTLVDRGYAARAEPARYTIGPRWGEAGPSLRPPRALVEAAHGVLERLTARTAETTFLAVLPPGRADIVYVDKVESPQRIRYTASLGEQRPLYCTATGLALFAFLPEDVRDRHLRALELERYTPRTTTSRALLRRRLDDIRAAGVAVTVDEYVIGAGGAAAPVFDREGRVVAACAVTGPTPRILAHRRLLADSVRRAAREISAALGCRSRRKESPHG